MAVKLISLHIENFGVFKDYTYLFKDGINTIVHENGWGKSTLAAFIRVMFYGFDNEGKRSEIENERKKFYPWQGGAYGGMLTFEAGGKAYRIERNFNDKKEGTFALYDAHTNLLSRDYSENIGEELFGIDAVSFERTAFIAQQDCITEVTSAINAKIGNIAENTADMGQYEEVQLRLKKEADSLTPSRRTGAIARLKDDIALKEARITPRAQREAHRADIASQMTRLTELKEENSRRIKNIQEDMKKVSAIKDMQTKKAEYERLRQAAEDAGARKEELKKSFPEGVADETELKEMLESSGELSSFEQTMRDFRLNEEERREEERIYDYYPNGFPEDTEISRLLTLYNDSGVRKNALPSKKANLRLMQDVKEQERNNSVNANKVKLAVGIIFILAAVIAAAFGITVYKERWSVSIVCFVAAIFAVAAGITALFTRRTYEGGKDSGEEELKKGIEEDEAFIKKTGEAVSAFLERLGEKEPEDGDLAVIFDRVREDKRKSMEFAKRRERFDEAHEGRKKLTARINAFLKKCGEEDSDDPVSKLHNVRDRLKELKEAERSLSEREREFESFCEENDTEKLKEDIKEPDRSMEELHSEFDMLQRESEELSDKYKSYEDELDACDEELSDIESDEEQLEEMRERLRELQYRYDIICDTRDYLEKAKVSFSAKYMEPIKRAFDKYYSVLSGDDGREYELDANLNIKVISRGKSRDTGFLSGGYQDLVGLCRRMAMIEAMYEDEKPFLILDDPFVNLDNDRVRGGINVLKKISDSYQIIYFTCHESRTAG